MKTVESRHNLPLPAWLDVLRAVLPPRGVLLVGAGTGQGPWVQWLQSRAIRQVCLVEGDEQQFQHLVSSLPLDAGWMPRRDVVAASAEPVVFHRASNPTESGLLAPERLRALWPNLTSEESVEAEAAVTLDMLNADAGNSLNWLVLDCLPAAQLLQGGAQLLGALDLALVRVTVQNDLDSDPAANHEAVDELLRAAGLHCIHVQAERHPALAHALYVRDAATQANKEFLDLAHKAVEELQQLRVVEEVWTKEKTELTRAYDATTQAIRSQSQKAIDELLRAAQESWAREKTELIKARDAAKEQFEQLSAAQEAWTKEKTELIKARDAAKEQFEQLSAAQEAWAKEKSELTQTCDATNEAVSQARAEAQKMAEQLRAAQEGWAKEKGELTQARDAANQSASQAKSEAQKAAEQLRAAQESWAKEKGELTQAREAANQAASQAKSEAQKVAEQLRVAQEGWAKEKKDLQAKAESADKRNQQLAHEFDKLRTQIELLTTLSVSNINTGNNG